MAAKQKVSPYKGFSLEWLRNKAQELISYVDSRPLHLLVDRMAYKQVKGGGQMPMVVSTVEQQRSDLSKAVKDYAEICKMIDELEEKEEKKMEKRGGGSVAGILEDEED